jgi:hypothetical protein
MARGARPQATIPFLASISKYAGVALQNETFTRGVFSHMIVPGKTWTAAELAKAAPINLKTLWVPRGSAAARAAVRGARGWGTGLGCGIGLWARAGRLGPALPRACAFPHSGQGRGGAPWTAGLGQGPGTVSCWAAGLAE